MDELIDYDAPSYQTLDTYNDYTHYYISTFYDNANIDRESHTTIYCDVETKKENALIESIKDKITFTYGDNPCVHIQDSYLITDIDDMTKILQYIHGLDEYKKLKEYGYDRTFEDELDEWFGHNQLYNFGVSPEQTGSVDIEKNEPLWRRIIYKLLRLFLCFNKKD